MISFSQLEQAGRLGNQMYQLAATIGIARSRGEEPRFNNWSYQPYFSFPEEFFTGEVGAPAVDCVPHIDPRARIYLQDYNLFKDIIPELREYFSPSPFALEAVKSFTKFQELPKPVLAVHIRRGDNVPGNDPGTPNKHLWHPCPPHSYYIEAIKMLPKASIAVFSDDSEWAEEKFGHGRTYVHHGTPRKKEHEPGYFTESVFDWIDWFMLKSCDFHVLSNSTFGIMAALMADRKANPITPYPIFGPNLDYIDSSLLFPTDWVKVMY